MKRARDENSKNGKNGENGENGTKVAKNTTNKLRRTKTYDLLKFLEGIEVYITNDTDEESSEESGDIRTNGIAPEDEPTNPE